LNISYLFILLFLLILRNILISTLFPYTTLFRSLFDVRTRDQKKNNANKIFVSEEILPQTLSVLMTRSTPIGVEVVVGNHETFDLDRKSTRLNSSHVKISYAVFCLKKKINNKIE